MPRLTSGALRTTFLWEGAGLERGIAPELCSDGQSGLVINIFPMILECGAGYILLACETRFALGRVFSRLGDVVSRV